MEDGIMKISRITKFILSLVVGLFCGCLSSTAVAKADSSPCGGINRSLSNISREDLTGAIAKQLNVPSPTVLELLATDNWSIIRVDPHTYEKVYLFYSGNPLKDHFITEWGGVAMTPEEFRIVREWVTKNAPGIPPKLAACFVWYVTEGRQKPDLLPGRP
jgi:hypothetical protein